MSFKVTTVKTFAFAALAVGLPLAAQAETQSFKRDGVSYQYTKSVENGREVLTGTADRVPFRFVVHGRYVTGQYNYRDVSFTRPVAKRTSLDVAAR